MIEQAFRGAIGASGVTAEDRSLSRLAYADWLEEQNRPFEAMNLRLLAWSSGLWPRREAQSGQLVDPHRRAVFVSGVIVEDSGPFFQRVTLPTSLYSGDALVCLNRAGQWAVALGSDPGHCWETSVVGKWSRSLVSRHTYESVGPGWHGSGSPPSYLNPPPEVAEACAAAGARWLSGRP